jgi:lipase ATG15
MTSGIIYFILYLQLFLVRSNLAFKTNPITVYRPKDSFAVQLARRSSLLFQQCGSIEWDPFVVPAPDVHDKHTLSQLARMAGNAYAGGSNGSNWYDLDPEWSTVRSFFRSLVSKRSG